MIMILSDRKYYTSLNYYLFFHGDKLLFLNGTFTNQLVELLKFHGSKSLSIIFYIRREHINRYFNKNTELKCFL